MILIVINIAIITGLIYISAVCVLAEIAFDITESFLYVQRRYLFKQVCGESL
jgi:hypothetical protein